MASEDIRAKRIFISDIHMGDQQSVDPPADLHPYGWFHQDRGRMHDMSTSTMTSPWLKEFLNELFPGINTDYIECGGWNNPPPW